MTNIYLTDYNPDLFVRKKMHREMTRRRIIWNFYNFTFPKFIRPIILRPTYFNLQF